MSPRQIRAVIQKVGGKDKLAREVGVSRRTVEGWLLGRRPSRSVILLIKRVAA